MRAKLIQLLVGSIVVTSAWPHAVYAELLLSPFQIKNKVIANIQSAKKTIDSKPVSQVQKLISLDFQDIEVRTILQMMAEYISTNLVMSEAVHGKISMSLRDVPWAQALQTILTTTGLAQQHIGNILLIDDAATIQQRAQAQWQAHQLLEKRMPIHSLLIALKYAKAADIALILKDSANSLLSAAGSVSVDVRTNSLLLRDKPQHLNELHALIQQLDIPTQQVEIEARIVNMNEDCAKDFGVRWGVTRIPDLSGTLAATSQLENATTSGAVALKDRLNLDLAALPLVGSPASTAFALRELGSHVSLDIELSALEREGRAHVIASPRLITTNQQQAIIESGEDIPYQESTLSGATAVSFKKAVLSLKVTPQITPNGKLLMDLVINHDTDSGRRVQGVPIIVTKLIQTKVLVNHGQTIVLGGILKQNSAKSTEKVPFIGSVPVVKYFFGRNETQIRHEELLIFITPRIMTNNSATTIVEK